MKINGLAVTDTDANMHYFVNKHDCSNLFHVDKRGRAVALSSINILPADLGGISLSMTCKPLHSHTRNLA